MGKKKWKKMASTTLTYWECLRKGKAFGPEIHRGQLRANVIHRGIGVRVAIGNLDSVNEDWDALESVKVVTVMKA